jgi:hypothetical protein
MEFASALLIRAAAAGASIGEVPVQLLPTPGKRVPHLRTWTDGMRHLLVILAGSPNFFWKLGMTLLSLSLALVLPCLSGPRIIFGHYGFWGEHTMVLALLIGFYGALAANVAILLHSRSNFPKAPASLRILLDLREGALFWWLVGTLVFTMAGCLFVLFEWEQKGYRNINYVTTILFFLYVAVVHSTLLFGIFQAQLGRRARI